MPLQRNAASITRRHHDPLDRRQDAIDLALESGKKRWAVDRSRQGRALAAAGLNIEQPAPSKPAVAPKDMELSPALRIVGKYPATLKGRAVGILVTDGADGAIIDAVRTAVEAEGGTTKIVAPKIGGVTLANGQKLKADG